MITQENIPYTANEIKAMVKTCEKYNKALERAKDMLTYEEVRREDMEYLFPEIKEPEDEKIKREIRNFIWGYPDKLPERDKWLNWLEKQSKQPTDNIESNTAWSEEDEEMLTWLCRIIHSQRLNKAITLKEESELGEWIDKWLNHNPQTKQSEQSTDKIKTKFNEGDYIVPYNVTSLEIWKIINIDDDGYYNIQPITNIINTEDNEIYRVPAFALEEDYYLWSINDAHDGDVLVDEDNNIGIYDEEKDDLCWHSCIYLGCDGRLRGFSIGGYHNNKNTKPAAKEQRELLFQKMKEAGYEWRQEEKKPIKMKETKFKVRDWIANGGANPCYVKSIFGDYYELCSCEGVEYTKHIIDVNYIYHRWTLADTKDGDVLVNGSNIFIFHFINDTRLMGYCHVNIDDGRFYDDIGKNECFCLIDAEVTPATKEQRDLLFEKMKNAGWEWDAKIKKLSKQTLKITPKFCVGQVITDDNGTWYKITNIKCLDDWHYELYDVGKATTHLELCSIIDEKFRENRFVSEIKKMLGD